MSRQEGFNFESAFVSAAVGGVLAVVLKRGINKYFQIQDARLLTNQHADIKSLVEESAKLRIRTQAKSMRFF